MIGKTFSDYSMRDLYEWAENNAVRLPVMKNGMLINELNESYAFPFKHVTMLRVVTHPHESVQILAFTYSGHGVEVCETRVEEGDQPYGTERIDFEVTVENCYKQFIALFGAMIQ